MRILLVEDNEILRQLLLQLLEDDGVNDVAEACDGEDAMKRIPHVRPQLIVTDFHMPHMDGIRFTKAIRAAGIATPVVMITAMADPELAEVAREAGVTEFLSKADESKILRAAFRKIVSDIAKAA